MNHDGKSLEIKNKIEKKKLDSVKCNWSSFILKIEKETSKMG